MRGYSSRHVTLLSPDGGETRTIWVWGRYRRPDGLWNTHDYYRYLRAQPHGHVPFDAEFYRLLSGGWRVLKPGEAVPAAAPKGTSVVVGTTKTGDDTHGGDHASAEVPDSPNRAQRGKRSRGRKTGQRPECGVSLHRTGGDGVYTPTPIRRNTALSASAARSGELLAELVGQSALEVREGVKVHAERLLLALETGDDPLPALEWPRERPRLRILVTPDCSGSTQGWSGLGQAWALQLASIPDLDVVYIENFNGGFVGPLSQSARGLVEAVEVLIYLGDGDGYRLCQQYASWGATVVALDSYCANAENPRLSAERHDGGTLYWVDRVSAKCPATWALAVELCLGS